jgi:Outer membrane protein beta-barrel domain
MQRLLVALVLALAAGAAQADDELFYLGAGVSSNKISDVTAINSDLNTTSWKAYVGVRPINAFAVEADYLDLGSKTINTTQSTTNLNYKAFAGYAVGFVPVPVPYLDVFGKVGLARWSSGGSTTSPGASLFSLSDNGTEFAWGVGAQAHIGSFGGRLEYEGFHIQNTSGAGVISLSVFLRL